MLTKRNSSNAMHMRTLWSSCLTTYLSLMLHLCWMTLRRNFQTTFFLVLGTVAPEQFKDLQTVKWSWSFWINASRYKWLIQVRHGKKKEIRKLYHNFFLHRIKNCLCFAIYRAYGALQNHACGWGQSMSDIMSESHC